jgi:RHS repeat-associated protein
MPRVTRSLLPPVVQTVLTLVLSVSLFYAPLLALRPPAVKAAASATELHPLNFSPPQQLALVALVWRKLGSLFQSGVNLDTLRGTTPQPPNSYQPSGSLPPSTYDDPKPVNTANYDAYLTAAVQPENATGPVGALPLQAPDPTVGHSVIGGVTADLLARRFNFTAPVLSLAGRAGLDAALALSYSNNLWLQSGGTQVFNVDRGFPAPGWRLGFGALQVRDSAAGGYYNSLTGRGSLVYHAPSGTRHDLGWTGSAYESYDGTYLRYEAATHTLSFPNGTRVVFDESSLAAGNYDYLLLPAKVIDRHGNFLTIVYRTLSFSPGNEKKVLDYVLDTAGRRIDFEYTDNRLTAIKQNRNGMWFYFVRLDYAPVTLQTNFAVTDPPLPNGSQVWAVTRLSYPTGMNLRFSYNSNGQMSAISKWAPTINGQGGERQIAATTFGYDTTYAPTLLSSRSETAEHWQGATYNYQLGQHGPGVTDSLGRWWQASLSGLTLNQYFLAPGSDSYAKRTLTTYAQDAGLSYRSNPRVVATEIWDTTTGGPSYTVRKSSTQYQQFHGMWLPVRQDDQPDGQGNSYRYTTTSYTHYPAQRILGLPVTVEVRKGNGVLLSKVENLYDQTGQFTDANNQSVAYLQNEPGVIQHEAAYDHTFTARGNLTSVVQTNVSTSATRTVKRLFYDTNGNLRGEADALGQRKQLDYADNYFDKPGSVGPTQVYPTLTTSPDLTAVRGGAQFHYFTGQSRKSYNLLPGSGTELQVVTTSYDFADRPLLTTKPDNGWARTDYWDNLLVVGTAQQIESGKVRFKWELSDGAGRVFKKASDHPDGVASKYAGQLFSFDTEGRVKDSSNVLAINGSFAPAHEDASANWLFTQMTYDAFSRLIKAQKPDNNEVNVAYEGCGCAGNLTRRVTDELGQYTETKTDLYGRLSEAVEPNAQASDGIYSKAVYSYDELDRLVQIEQRASYNWNYSTTPTQTRTFSYDGWGQLVTEVTPEAGTASYVYKANGLLEAATNANGKTVSYSYNARNLPVSVSYSDTTPAVSYQYDAWGARTQMTDGAGQTSYSYNSLRQLQSETRSFTDLPDKQYTLSYNYNQAEQVTSASYLATSGYQAGAPLTYNHFGLTQAPPYTLSGTITNQQGQPVAGVTVTLSGAESESTTTNGSGQFSFGKLENGNYTVTPSLAGHVFNPASITYNDLQRSWSNANFTALPAQQTTFEKRVNYAYNTVGALSGVGTNLLGSDPNNTTNVINGLSFKAFGAIKQLNYGNGLQLTMGYNANRQQPISMKVGPNGTGTILDYSYEYYDAQGHNNNRIRSITDATDGAYSVSYTYDQWNRLTHATAAGYARYYTYDPFGNLKTVTGTGGPQPNYTLNYAQNGTTAPATNRILSVTENGYTQPFSYDQAGNLTAGDGQSYVYDAANRLKEVNAGALGQYGYDGDGARVKKVEGGVTTHYVRSGVLGQVAFEVTSTSVQRAYVYAHGKLVAQQTPDGQFHWLHTNHLNSGRAMTDANGNLTYKGQLDPHGQTLFEWSAAGNPNLNTRKFTGYERDGTGLDYANARTYTGNRGRFMQPDPIGLGAAKLKVPQSLNRYAYVGNDPANVIDPTGYYDDFCAGAYYWRFWGMPKVEAFLTGEICVARGGGGGSGDQGGRGGGGSRSNIKPPKAKIKTPGRETAPGCGKSEFDIEWEIEGAGRGGWLIQHVIIETNVLNADGSVKEKKTTEYWEAWRVGNDGKLQGSGTDTFRFESYGAETRGSLSATGYAKYYEGYTLPDDFRLGGAGSLAGDLRSTMDKPSGWTDENAYMHQLKVNFNCVGDGEPTDIRTTPTP